MAVDNFRAQFSRGTTAENDLYTGADGELTLDKEAKNIRVHDGVTPGGEVFGGAGALKVVVNSWAAANYTVDAGVAITKDYSDTSIKIQHNKGKFPTGWFGLVLESVPMVGMVSSSTRNMQIVDANTVIITNISSFDNFEINLQF